MRGRDYGDREGGRQGSNDIDRYGGYNFTYEGEDELVCRARPSTIVFLKINGKEDVGLWIYATNRLFKKPSYRRGKEGTSSS
ncbi:unnamed protein product [Linum trigynum]|uniref:Uncharacterized protein n=1 Tax=Linum trigynum TaxID=586398 RepID=A0AAV2D2B6_9ROSI